MRIARISGLFVLFLGLVASFGGACASKSSPSTFTETSGSTTTAGPGAGPGAGGAGIQGTASSTTGIINPTGTGGAGGATMNGPCMNLQCQQTTCTLGSCKEMPCAAGAKTSISGTVYDPAGKVPLYNVIVYVPNSQPMPFTAGATCDRCSANSLNAVVSTLTDTQGHFVLNNAPVGANIPLVIQIGKWRRQVTVANVPRCVDTAVADKEMTRLPKNKTEGDIPLIAITTGGADSMECLPLRMGIDAAEFTNDTGSGRIHLYSGLDGMGNPVAQAFDASLNGGAALTDAPTLWNSIDNLKKYDIVILSCEGNTNEPTKPPAARQALYDYESVGGRVFGSHWHHLWFSAGPAPVPQIATWRDLRDPRSPSTGFINTGFPKGQAMSDWLVNVGASTTPGQLDISAPRDNVTAVNAMMATDWIDLHNAGMTVEFLSYNAPLNVPADQLCGRAIYTDLHVSATTGDKPGAAFPAGCMLGDLSAQEKALEFMLFDLSACVTPDSMPPPPPR